MGGKMTDFEKERNFDGTDAALVLLTLGSVGGFLWLDHKLRMERTISTALTEKLQKLAPDVPLPAVAQSRLALPAPTLGAAPARNASSLARLPRLELAPRTYDDVFANRGRGLPVAYLRALALHESDMRPRLADGPAWGLTQVMEVVREDFNHRERTNFTRQDLLDPAVNVTIAASAIALIIKSYSANHPNTPSMQANWRDPQFVALVTYGWNAGWSERGGVGRVVSFLEQRGLDVTINAVFDAAKASGASPHLANAMKLEFAKKVTRQYFVELADEERVIEIEAPLKRESSDRPAVVVEAPGVVDAPSSPPMPHERAGDSPGFVIEHAIPEYVPMSAYGHPEHAPGPIRSASQLEYESEPPGVVLAPIDPRDVVAAQFAATAVPPMQAYPSGGSGPIDPYDEPTEHNGYPEDPYAYAYPESGAPHA
jgi:Transglycosylase SLT domain